MAGTNVQIHVAGFVSFEIKFVALQLKFSHLGNRIRQLCARIMIRIHHICTEIYHGKNNILGRVYDNNSSATAILAAYKIVLHH